MTPAETDSLVAITLMAAFCDGQKQDQERSQIKAIFESLGVDNAPDIYRRVMLKQVELDDVVQGLDSLDKRQFAYELAVGVCDADDVINAQEKEFLERLQQALGLSRQDSQTIETSASAIADAPAAFSKSDQQRLSTSEQRGPEANEEQVAQTIIRYAVFAAALELLPQSLATLAIVPVQVRMVYRIGALNGYTLDVGHIKEFIGTIGVGLTSQYVEGIARKFLGGWASRFVGGMGAAATRAATGGAITFAASYAIGKVAQSYYAGGRKLNADAMQRMFADFRGQANGLYANYQGAISEQAKNIDVSKLSSLIQGGL